MLQIFSSLVTLHFDSHVSPLLRAYCKSTFVPLVLRLNPALQDFRHTWNVIRKTGETQFCHSFGWQINAMKNS